MKKELIALLQFVLIAVFVGYGYFGLLLIQGTTVLSLWDEYAEFFIYWVLSFVSLSIIRLAVYYLALQKKPYDSIQPKLKDLIEKEFSKTIQYVILAGISGLITFYTNLPLAPGISINIEEAWLNFEKIFSAWMIGFLMLSLLRVGIMYIKSKPFQDEFITKY